MPVEEEMFKTPPCNLSGGVTEWEVVSNELVINEEREHIRLKIDQHLEVVLDVRIPLEVDGILDPRTTVQVDTRRRWDFVESNLGSSVFPGQWREGVIAQQERVELPIRAEHLPGPSDYEIVRQRLANLKDANLSVSAGGAAAKRSGLLWNSKD